MEIDNLYQLAERERIDIVDYKMHKTKARIINFNNASSIFIDYRKIKNLIDEKCTLAEELGHYYYDAYYSPTCKNQTIIDKQEYKAKKWQIKALVPINELSSLLKQGYNTFYDIANKLDVSEDLVQNAFNYYKNNNMLKEI